MALMASMGPEAMATALAKATKDAENSALASQRKADEDEAEKAVVGYKDDVGDLRKALQDALVELAVLRRASKSKVVKSKDGKVKKVVQKCAARKAWENKKLDKLASGVWHRSFNDLKSCGKTALKGGKYCVHCESEASNTKNGVPTDGDFGVAYDWPAHKSDPRKAGWLKGMADAHPKWAADGQLGVIEKVVEEEAEEVEDLEEPVEESEESEEGSEESEEEEVKPKDHTKAELDAMLKKAKAKAKRTSKVD